MQVLWYDLEGCRDLSFQRGGSSLWNEATSSKREKFDEFLESFDRICDSIGCEAHRLVNRPQGGEETWDATVLKNKIRHVAYALEGSQNRDPELSTNTYEKNEELFSTLISQERLLIKALAQGSTTKAEENRKQLIQLYNSFPVILKRVLVRLGLDEAIGTLVTIPLHRAVRLSDAQILRSLLRCGASPYSADYVGRTILHVAAESNAIETVNVLLSSSTDLLDLDQSDIFGRSALYLSIQAEHTELARKLLALRGNEQRKDCEWKDLHVLAAESGNITLVRLLLLTYGDLSMATASVRSAGLIAAVWTGRLDIVQLFVAANADLQGTAGDMMTALDVAIKAGDFEIVKFFLSVNTNVNARRDQQVMGAIHYAVIKGFDDILDMLLRTGADINASFNFNREDDYGICIRRKTTTLELASEHGRLYAVRQLLDHPMVVVNRELGAYERSSLELAAKKGHEGVVDLLLSRGADVNICYSRHNSTTSLLEAVRGGHIGIVKALIEAGADVNAFYSHDESCYKTVLQASALAGTAANAKAMISKKMSPNRSNISHTADQVECKIGEKGEESDGEGTHEDEDEDGSDEGIEVVESIIQDTALQLAARKGNLEILRILLKAGADVNAPPQRYGGTALQYAAFTGRREILEILLSADAAIEAKGGKMTALQGAAKGGHFWIAEWLLRRKAEVDATSPNSHEGTPLQLAAKGGHLRTVLLLLDWHADINRQLPNGHTTPLQAAVYQGNLEIVRLLLETGATVDEHPGEVTGGEELTALQAAVRQEHLDVVRILIAAGADPNAPAGTYGFTALSCAAAKGNVEITKTLLLAGARGVDLAYRHGLYQDTVLQRASVYGRSDVARLLLQSNADPNAPALGDFGRTALQGAAYNGHLELTSILLEAGADVNGQPSLNGTTALSYSLDFNYQNIARLLIDAGADVNAISGRHYHCATALQMAAKNGFLESVDRLVYAGADVNAISRDGETALTIAIQNDKMNVVYRLLEASADVNTGHPLERAVRTKQTAIVRLLLGKGADVNAVRDSGFDERDYSSPMESAVLHGSLEVMQLLVGAGTNPEILGHSLSVAAENNYLEKLKILLAAGADPDIVNRGGCTALHEAAYLGHVEITCFLLGAGADPNTINAYGDTVLGYAARYGHLEVVRSLLLAGAATDDASRSTTDEMTALHFAAKEGKSEIVRLLLIAGADTHAKTDCWNGTKQSALDLAISSGSSETVQILRDANLQKPLWPSNKRKRVDTED